MSEARQSMAPERRSRSFISHAATYAIGNIARRVVGFAMLPIYTRFLTPADYGVVGLLTFALALFEPIFGARLGWAIPKFYVEASDERSKRAVIWGALTLTGGVSVVTMTVIILFRAEGSEVLFGNRNYGLALGLFAVNLLSGPVEQIVMTYIRLKERSRLFLGVSMVKLALQIGLNLLLVVWWRDGVVGIVLSGIISSIAIGAWGIPYVAAREAPAFEREITRNMVRFSWPLWLSGLAGLYTGSSGAVYLRTFDTLSDVGRLELALRFASALGVLVWVPFSQHWEPMSFNYYKEATGARKFQVAFIAVSVLMFVGGLGISIFAEPVIRIMASRSFHAAADVVPILTFGFLLNNLRQFFTFSFIVTGNTKLHSVCQYLSALIITIAYVVLVPWFGLAGAAWAQCLAFTAAFIYTHRLSRRYYDPGFNLALIGTFTAIGSLAYVCANVALSFPNPAVDLLSKSLIAVIATALILYVGLRAILSVNSSSFEVLPWPLDRLGRLRIGKQPEA
jgi:O-antigen/teichoic acid export membrane protein